MATLEEQIREPEARRAKGAFGLQLLPPKKPDTPKMRSMPQAETLKGLKEMMAPMGAGGTNVKPRSMNADRDKAYDTDVELKKGGKVSSASKRADGCAIRGKTRA